MEEVKNTRGYERYVALDIHKEYVLAGGQNAKQEWVILPRRISMAKFREWATVNLREGDAVVLETTTNVWDIYDIVAPLASRTVVAHAGAVRQIAEARVKTDKEDVKRLIRLLIADIVPDVWVPPAEVRELRGVISYRNRLVKMGTMVRNRLQSLLHSHNILLPKGKLLDGTWWQEQKVSTLEKLQIQQELAILEELDRHKTEVDAELGRQCLRETWSQQAVRLLQLPGFGVVMTMIVLSAIGGIHRFADAQHLVGYAGLGTKVHDSGMTSRSGRITKAGRCDLRVVLTEAAQVAANSHPHWKAELARLQPRLGRNKAIVAIARKILIAVWFVLQGKTDKYAEPEGVAQKMLKFAYTVGKANRPKGQTAAQFARIRMDALGLGQELTSIPWGSKKPIPLPPSSLKIERSDVPNGAWAP